MIAALCFSPSLSLITPQKITTSTPLMIFHPNQQIKLLSRCSPIKAVPSETVDYSSSTSVFPAEACETIGGEACNAEIYPEAKLEPEVKSTTTETASESVDREYLDYSEPKTVFPAEACDDLGGEFCEPEYQKGVYK